MPGPAITIGLVLFATLANGQVKPPLAVADLKEGLNPFEEIRLFDLTEIRARRIDTAWIIYHPASWAEYHLNTNPNNCSYNDTLSRYIFDKTGRIIQESSFQIPGRSCSTIFYDSLGQRTAMTQSSNFGTPRTSTIKYDHLADSSYYKHEFLRVKKGEDSIITDIHFVNFKGWLDTAYVQVKRFNSKGKLIEIESSVNKRNAQELDDDTGSSTYHLEYNYDDQDRLTYYRDYSTREFQKISYPFFGKLTEIYDVKTNQVKKRQVKNVRKEDGVVYISFDVKQITLTPLEKNSKLFKLISVVEQGPIPLLYFHEIVYKSK